VQTTASNHVGVLGAANRVALDGPYAYVAAGGAGLAVVDVTSSSLVGSIATGEANGIAVANGFAYVADGHDGLVVVDVSVPETPTIASIPNPCSSYGLALHDHHVYLAVFGGLQVFDVVNPRAPAYVGDVDWMSSTFAVAILDHYAFFADNRRGVRVFDIADPTLPRLVREVDTPGEPRDLVVAGEHLYVADGPSGLQIVDISDPETARLVAGVDTPGFATGITVSGRQAYVADGNLGVQVIDIDNPSSPVALGVIPTGGEAGGIVVRGQDLVVADGDPGLLVLPQRAQPNSVPLCEPGGPYDGQAGAVVAFEGLRSKDLDGRVVRLDWSFGDGATATGLRVSHVYEQPGTYLVFLCVTDDDGSRSCCETTAELLPTAVELTFEAVADRDAVHLVWYTSLEADLVGFLVHRSSDGEPFTRLNEQPIPTAGRPHRYEFVDRQMVPGTINSYRLEVLERDGSRHVYERQVQVPARALGRMVLYPNVPNPFNPTTRLEFDIPRAESVTLRVHDAAGRRVRALLQSAELASGRHDVLWDGRDDRGRAAPAGVYWVQLVAGAESQRRKIVLVE
jgi:hypothetical protein